jgi:DNA repair exonuclease SbcCD ATPase subunit
MKNLNFKYAKAQNFLCFGEEGIEINFEQYGNIVCVKGNNLDVSYEDGSVASNGSGKSSIPEIIVYGLFGQTIKKPTKLNHPDIINNNTEGKLVVEVRWDNFRLVRTRTTDNRTTLQLWESAEGVWDDKTNISVGGAPTTQKEVIKKLGLTYEAFINVFIFSDDNIYPFLECETGKKRIIVENLLSLDKYRNFFEAAKDSLKGLKDKTKDLTKEYEVLCQQKDTAAARITQVERQEKDWLEARKRELDRILNEIKNKRDELEKSKSGAALATYQEAQERIVELKQQGPALEERKTKLNDVLAETMLTLDKVNNKIADTQKELSAAKANLDPVLKVVNDNRKIVEEAMKKSGKECPYCFSVVEEKNFEKILTKAHSILVVEEPKLTELQTQYDEIQSRLNSAGDLKRKIDIGIADFKTKLTKVNSEISELYCDISELSKIPKPDSDLAELLLAEQIESLKKQSIDKQAEIDGVSPLQDIKRTAFEDLTQKIKECDDKKEEIKNVETEVPYHEFWVKAFGDTGIRKYVIDGIIPTLNERIEYWLQFLIDNKIKLTFDNELNETIDRFPFNGRPYVYHGMSGGQRRRLKLTVAAAWAFISALNSGASPSVIFLDEVTMNMDIVGIEGIYRMICELAKEKQVFVIDHNEILLQMLDGCDVISLEMKDEISKKVIDTVSSNC